MVHYNFVNGKRPSSSELKSHLDCFAKVIQCPTKYIWAELFESRLALTQG